MPTQNALYVEWCSRNRFTEVRKGLLFAGQHCGHHKELRFADL